MLMFLLKLVCSCCKGPFYPFLVAETNKVFFDKLNETLNKAVNKYDNIFIAGDLNIDTTWEINLKIQIIIYGFVDAFSLNNLTEVKTCYKSASGSILYIMLTNKMRSF